MKLSDKISNASNNDTDNDGISDADELGSKEEKDMKPYIYALLNSHEVSIGSYQGKTHLSVYNYKSNPVYLDTNFDGIPDDNKDYDGTTVTPDSYPNSNTFKVNYTIELEIKILLVRRN